jgi:hypothetical protein
MRDVNQQRDSTHAICLLVKGTDVLGNCCRQGKRAVKVIINRSEDTRTQLAVPETAMTWRW